MKTHPHYNGKPILIGDKIKVPEGFPSKPMWVTVCDIEFLLAFTMGQGEAWKVRISALETANRSLSVSDIQGHAPMCCQEHDRDCALYTVRCCQDCPEFHHDPMHFHSGSMEAQTAHEDGSVCVLEFCEHVWERRPQDDFVGGYRCMMCKINVRSNSALVWNRQLKPTEQ